ncbi:ATP-binding protein [candidate division CSSED10-310 bacterium]|uniref:histidine kinase n=1 Tax=candidate division CSSED10-310 bacterium TaxID=2855610 RepID=A0ABV6YVH4_UNCC1
MNLQRKLSLILVGFVTTLVILTGSISIIREKRVLENKIYSRMSSIAHDLASLSTKYIITDDLVSLRKLVIYIKQKDRVCYAMVLDQDDKILMHDQIEQVGRKYQPSMSKNIADNGRFASFEHQSHDTIQEISVPITIATGILGSVRLGFSLSLRPEAKQAYIHLSLMSLVTMIIGLCCAIFVARLISKPIMNISHATLKVAHGDLRQVVAAKSGDEIGILAENFNIMTRNLQQTTVSRDYFESIIEGMTNTLLIVDRKRKIRTVNRALCDLSGYRKGELLGNDVEMIMIPDRRVDHIFKTALKEMIPEQRFLETRYKTKDQKCISMILSIAPFLNRAGEMKGIIAIAENIENLKKAEQTQRDLENQLYHAQKMDALSTLARGIAHDFNNLLGSIIGNVDLACLEARDQKIRDPLQEVLQGSYKAQELIQQIMIFSRKDTPEKKSLDLRLVVSEALVLLKSSIPATVEIHQNLPENICLIHANPSQMSQVVLNLCHNAIQAMKEKGGILDIKLTSVRHLDPVMYALGELAPGNYLELMIKDTGQGIKEEIMAKIFDPYFTTKTGSSGSGLGLAIVHSIVKNHGGAIRVTSIPGSGSSFMVSLPEIKDK